MRSSTSGPLIAVLSLTLALGCGGADDPQNGEDPQTPLPQARGLVVSNGSAYTVSRIFVRSCGARPWSTKLSRSTPTPPQGTAELRLEAGCYDLVAVGEGASGILHRHAPGLVVTKDGATRVALATADFRQPDESEACATTGEGVDGAVYVVGNFVVMDEMLDPVADAYMRQEFVYQTAFFNLGVQIGFFGLMDSQGANAVATQGWIAFGDYLYLEHGELHGAAGVQSSLAHEYGHIAQHALGFRTDPRYYALGADSVLILELEADAFAGYYMAHPAGKNASAADLENMYAHFYMGGTDAFDFYNAGWHGTRYQRFASNFLGAQIAYLGYQAGYNYSYQELHDLFLYTILTEIVQNPSPTGKAVALAPAVQDALARLPLEKIRDLAQGSSQAW